MAGFSSTHGNTFNESGSISFNASRNTKKDKTKVEGIYLVSRTRDDDTNKISLQLGYIDVHINNFRTWSNFSNKLSYNKI